MVGLGQQDLVVTQGPLERWDPLGILEIREILDIRETLVRQGKLETRESLARRSIRVRRGQQGERDLQAIQVRRA